MSWIACCVPRAVWHTPLLQMSVRGGPPAGSSTTPRVRYTCILQMSEATVPVNNLVTLWEWRGASAPQRPSQHLRDTLHLWHRCGTAVAPLWHRCGISPLWHHYGTSEAHSSPRRNRRARPAELHAAALAAARLQGG